MTDQLYEQVHHPRHYGGADDPYECIKVLEAWGLLESFCLSNVVKYISRSDRKGDRITDLKKAAWYLNYEVTRLEKMAHVTEDAGS